MFSFYHAPDLAYEYTATGELKGILLKVFWSAQVIKILSNMSRIYRDPQRDVTKADEKISLGDRKPRFHLQMYRKEYENCNNKI